MNKVLRCCLIAAALVLTAGSLSAALQFTLVPAVQSGAVTTQLTFSGTLTNTSATDNLFLNDIHFDFNAAAAAALAADSNVFFANVPGILGPNETYTGPIFTVTINSSAEPTDYFGSVVIRGGADIFDLTDLLSQNFQIASPSITVSTGTADAFEFGAVPGTLTITRTGSTNYDLMVHYAVAGSASPGVRYSSLPGVVTIPSGAASATINIVPIPNDVVDGAQTVMLTLGQSGSYNPGVSTSGTVTIHDKPIDEWRAQHFGANANIVGIAGDAADPDHDGMSNLLEYGLFSEPNVSNVEKVPLATIAANHLQLQFDRNSSATDVTYIVQSKSDLASADWASVATRTPGNDWTIDQSGAVVMESGSGDFVSVTVTDSMPVIDPTSSQPLPKRFLRLRIER
jgi:hypothetical protein